VAFPYDVLAEEEGVVLHLHPHWRATVRPILLVLLAVAATTTAWVMLPTNSGGRIGFAVVAAIMLYQGIRYGARPLAIWRCTHYVITDERILLQDGVLARERRDLPLNRVNDHVLSQSLLDRFFGSGTLTIDSIGDQAAVLASVPDAHQVQSLLYELIEEDRLGHPDDDEDEIVEPEVPAQRRGFFRRAGKAELSAGKAELSVGAEPEHAPADWLTMAELSSKAEPPKKSRSRGKR
jgi:uncharacterized membrane protein YdbT with pleckstrin-like domain